MFTLNDDLSIYATRGDIVFFSVSAEDDGKAYTFKAGDLVRVKIFGKKDAENVVLQKDFPVTADTEAVEIFLTEDDTKIGEVISKPKDYWYEVELNPLTNPQTIIGYDDNGAKVFKLFPEGDDIDEDTPIQPEDIPVVDDVLDVTSTRPVENQAIARAVVSLKAELDETKGEFGEKLTNTNGNLADVASDVAVERARIDNIVAGATADGAEVADIRVGADGKTYASAGTAVREQITDIKDHIGEFEPHIWYQSVNRFNADEQTEHTIDPYYHGADGAATSNDGYHFTAPIPVEPNTQYTIGYVPSVNVGSDEVTVPWHNAAAGCFFYDKNGNMLTRTQEATFTTTADTAYIRFNYLRSNYYDLDLSKVKEVCMIVKGDTLPDTFSAYYNYFIDEVVADVKKQIENGATMPPPLYYDIAEDVVSVVSKYTADKDLVTVLQKKGGNNIFDFYKFGTIENETDTPSSQISSMTQFLGITTDCHAPFNVTALSNIDGNALQSSAYTGGNHAYDGIITGRTSFVRFFADGREKTKGVGYAHSIKIIWENLVQAWNTVKTNGTGREVIKERHTVNFDGNEWKETIELFPLEDIKIGVWYGLQMYGLSNVYNQIRYVGGANRAVNDASVNTSCGDNVASKVIGYGDEHRFEMEIDPSFDLGKRTMYSGTTGIFTSGTKCYFYIIRNHEMKSGTMYSLKGAYRFLPNEG